MAFQSTITGEQRLENKELSGMRIPIAVKAWSTASGEVFASGAIVTFQSDTVLYAMWNSTDYPKTNYYDRLVYKV